MGSIGVGTMEEVAVAEEERGGEAPAILEDTKTDPVGVTIRLECGEEFLSFFLHGGVLSVSRVRFLSESLGEIVSSFT